MVGPSVDRMRGVTRRERKAYVVLPAFNEEARIGVLLDRIDEAMREAKLDYEIIVVNDGIGAPSSWRGSTGPCAKVMRRSRS